MPRIVQALTRLTVLLVLASQLVAAESARVTPPSGAERPEPHKVHVTADEIGAVAEGDGAVAQIQIGTTSTNPARSRQVTIHVGKIVRKAIGPHAVACIQLPSKEETGKCEQ